MSRASVLRDDPILVAVSFSVVAIHIVAFGVAMKDRWDRKHQHGRDNYHFLQAAALCKSAETRRYPFVSGIDHETAIARSTALPVLYGRDGRRRLAGGAVSLSTDEGQILEPTEIRAASDPTGKALSSPDVIVAVFGFLDRTEILACSNVSVAFNQAATADTIWIDFVKSDTAHLLCEHLDPGTKALSRDCSARQAFLSHLKMQMIQGGLDRVIEHVYTQLPRSYFDIYPRLPPTRELVPPSKARKSWHRLYLSMLVWVPYMILQTNRPKGARGDKIPKAWTQAVAEVVTHETKAREPAGLAVYTRSEGHMALGLRRKSRAAIEKYGGTAFFPEQVLYFVSNLFFSCCGDYFAELITVQNTNQQEAESLAHLPEKQVQLASAVPVWADMMSVVHGYVDLYKMRLFYVLQDNRGFLLQHPAPATAASNMDDGSNGENIGGANVETQPAPKRQLRIACSHKLFVENIENPAKRLTGWPYVRQMSLDGFMEEFNIVKASR